MASLALLLLLAPAPAALRLSQQREAENGGSETCSREPRERIEEDLPPGPGYLGPGISLRLRRESAEDTSDIESAMREYQTNLSFVRVCNTIKDKTTALAPLIVPSLKLAFCYVPKVACTQFKDLINALNELGLPEGFGQNYLKSTPWNLHVNRADITKENGWKFATFTRDPALRYLSAFGSTCVSKGPKESYEHKFECCGPLVKDNTMPAETIVSMFEQRAQFDLKHGVVKEDDHWVSQVQILRMCSWERFKPSHLDFHGRISGDMNAQVRAMLKMVDAKPWMLKKADKLFPPSGNVAGHQSPLHRISPEMFYRNASTLEAIQKLYEDDYKLIPQVGCSFTDLHTTKPASRPASALAPAAAEQSKVSPGSGPSKKEGSYQSKPAAPQDQSKPAAPQEQSKVSPGSGPSKKEGSYQSKPAAPQDQSKPAAPQEPEQKEVKKEEGHKEGEQREDEQNETKVNKEPEQKEVKTEQQEVKKEEGHEEGQQREDVQTKKEVDKEHMDEKEAAEARRKHEEEKRTLSPEELRKRAVARQKNREEERKKQQRHKAKHAQDSWKREQATQKKLWEEKRGKQEKAKKAAQAKWKKNHMA